MELTSASQLSRTALVHPDRLARPVAPAPQALTDRPAGGTAPTAPGGSSTVEALLADWGRAGSPHDLDGNGTVDVNDLLTLLARLSNPVELPATGAGVEAAETETPADVNELPTPQALLDAWGTKDPETDLNGDGTVNVNDLLMLLAKMSDGHSVQEAPAPSPVDQLIAAWGSTDAAHDLDGDGTVGVKDLLALLARMSGGTASGGTDGSQAAVPPMRLGSGGSLSPSPAVNIRAAAEHLAAALWKQAGTTGFEKLRQSLEQSSLSDAHKNAVLNRIAEWAPRGSQLSLVG